MRGIHQSSATAASKSIGDIGDVVVDHETNSANDASSDQQRAVDDTVKPSSSGGGCSQGVSLDHLDEYDDGYDSDEQEEMFVVSDPAFGLDGLQEWGGPRRGGRLMEPTRFGDWERKGRCTDF